MPLAIAGDSRPRNKVDCLAFSIEALNRTIAELSGAAGWAGSNHQTEYLGHYLANDLAAQAMVVEHHYIDRHFMEEVGSYYSSCLVAKPNACGRIHVFGAVEGRTLDSRRLTFFLRRAHSGRKHRVAATLQEGYLGFIVVRPLPSVPIGRSVLAFVDDAQARRVGVDYTVHFLGLELTIHGLAFQQQDRAVGACATTSVWMALQRLCRHEGRRTVTPSSITEAAVRHFVPAGRPYPSPGLTLDQICESLREHQFPPVLFFPRNQLFLLWLSTYLRSGIPVILALSRNGSVGHAVTAVGFRDIPGLSGLQEIADCCLQWRNLDFREVYISDDRLGPYKSAELRWAPADEEQGATPAPVLILDIRWHDGSVEEFQVRSALAPLYPKLRTDAQDLWEVVLELAPVVKGLFADAQISVEIFFERSGDYLSSLYDLPVDTARLAKFLKNIALSRYVGIVRWYRGEHLLFDTVWDTTDKMRETRVLEQLLAAVVFDGSAAPKIRQLAGRFGVPSC